MRVTNFFLIHFKFPLGRGGKGDEGGLGGFFATLQKEILLPMIIAFLTLDEIEFGVSDLGM